MALSLVTHKCDEFAEDCLSRLFLSVYAVVVEVDAKANKREALMVRTLHYLVDVRSALLVDQVHVDLNGAGRPLRITSPECRVLPWHFKSQHLGLMDIGTFHDLALFEYRSLFAVDETDDLAVSEHVHHLRTVTVAAAGVVAFFKERVLVALFATPQSAVQDVVVFVADHVTLLVFPVRHKCVEILTGWHFGLVGW